MHEPARPRVLVLGARGQVGWELTRTLAPLGDVCAADRASLDLSDLTALRDGVRAARADVIVNAAAYTQVDRAEAEPDVARRVNGDAPGVLVDEARRAGALLVHFSTDYVFDGTGSRPYVEDDATGPRTAYGSSKLAGDEAVLATDADAYVFRVGWVYGRRGRNFLRTIERVARERDELRIVADQHGAPTWSRAIAEATTLAVWQWMVARRLGTRAPERGVYHMGAPDRTTWHQFASEIVASMPSQDGWTRPVVKAISTSEYPTPAARPAWSVLDSGRLRDAFGIALPGWREQLALCLENDA